MSDRLEALRDAGELEDLDVHFARMMVRLSGAPDDDLALAGALASRATGEGHVCVDLARVAGTRIGGREGAVRAPELEAWCEALAASRVVARAGACEDAEPPAEPGMDAGARPLVLDAVGRLYLERYWRYEVELARALLERAREPLRPAAGDAALRERLAALFPQEAARGGTRERPVDLQKIAAAVASLRSLCVVSGGPGTGKTTTVTKILALLVSVARERPPRIAVAAPTGKAAARMIESMRATMERLDLPDDVRAAIPQEARTLHRLLGARPGSVSFRHDREHPLPVDVLVVDEASMVDLAMMAKLVRALPPAARLILLGDRDQLASVEAGAVLGDLCARPAGFSPEFVAQLERSTGARLDVLAAGPGASSPVADSIVLLERSYRFGPGSGIGEAARAVNAGHADDALAVLRDPARRDVAWGSIGELPVDLGDRVAAGFGPYLSESDPRRAFEALERFRILCARRTGPYGSEAMNRRVERLLAERGRVERRGAFYRGRPVLVTENDYGLRLYNGDIGIALPDPDHGGELRVFFLGADGTVRKIAPARLPSHETAFALTVHKSQGSEFEDVLLVLDAETTPVLTRELVYTGITRARRSVEVRGEEPVFRAALDTPVMRSSGLRDALWNAPDAPASGGEPAVAAVPTERSGARDARMPEAPAPVRRKRRSSKESDDDSQLRFW